MQNNTIFSKKIKKNAKKVKKIKIVLAYVLEMYYFCIYDKMIQYEICIK